jgi:hypothetical protein
LLQVQKVLLELFVVVGGGFQRTIFRVPVALADFFAQIVQHDTTRTRNAASLGRNEDYDQLSPL